MGDQIHHLFHAKIEKPQRLCARYNEAIDLKDSLRLLFHISSINFSIFWRRRGSFSIKRISNDFKSKELTNKIKTAACALVAR